mgnify:CR=1 FL=1
MIGTTFNELQRLQYDQPMTQEQALEQLRRTFGDETDAYVKAFAKAYPNYQPQDLVSIDWLFRPKTLITADALAAQLSPKGPKLGNLSQSRSSIQSWTSVTPEADISSGIGAATGSLTLPADSSSSNTGYLFSSIAFLIYGAKIGRNIHTSKLFGIILMNRPFFLVVSLY